MNSFALALGIMLFQNDNGAGAGLLGGLGGACCGFVVGIVIAGVLFMGLFKKAGRPTWEAFVPLLNTYRLLEIVGRPGWWIIGFFVPVINIVLWIVVGLDLAQSFGKEMTYAIGIIILPIIFVPLLGYGDAQYLGPKPYQFGGAAAM